MRRALSTIAIIACLAAPAAADLADGTYWVRRITAETSRGMEGHGPDGPGEHWFQLRTECRQMTVTTVGKRRELVIGDVGLSIYPEPGKWVIATPVVTSGVPPMSLTGTCKDTLAPDDLPIFRDRASCTAAPSSVTRRCLRDACRYDGVAPFVLPSCDAALTALAADAAPITQATHDDAVRSLRRLTDITRRGGKLWLRDPEVERCHPVTVKPLRDGAVALRQSIALGGGARVDFRAEVTFEPLYHRARYRSESRWHEGGGGGGYGISDTTTGLYLGRNVVLAGTRWFYFDRRTCDAGPH